MAVSPLPSRPLDGGSRPEELPWATSGTTLEPSAGQEDLGHRPQSTGGPPDYRLENWFRAKLNGWLQRLSGVTLLAERAQKKVTIGGTVGEGDEYDFSFDAGLPYTYTTPAGYTTHTQVAAGAAAYLQSEVALAALYAFESDGADVYATRLVPGVDFRLESAIGANVSGAPTATDVAITGRTVATQKRLAIRPGNDDGLDVDLVVGSTSTEDLGTAATRARMVWRKFKYAFRVGKASGAEWDDANVGSGSMAWGEDCQASGAHSTAGGYNSEATADGAVALGRNNTASAVDAVALGNGSEATGARAFAAGGGAQASGADAVAMGNGASAAGDNAVAMGSLASAGDDNAVALGLGANAGGSGSTAIGPGATVGAGSTGGVALGTGQVTGADGDNALAGPGSTATKSKAVALGGGEATAAGAVATGNGQATEDYSRAHGPRCITTTRGEFAHAATSVLNANDGESQWGTVHAAGRTVGDVSTVLTPGGSSTTTWTLLPSAHYQATVTVVAGDETDNSGIATWEGRLTILVTAAGVPDIKHQVWLNGTTPGFAVTAVPNPSVMKQGLITGNPPDVQVAVNGNSIDITVDGKTGRGIRWSARIDYVQVLF